MPEKCLHCGQRYQLEPQFYSGALYVSYALQVALFTSVCVTLNVLFDAPMEAYMIGTIASALMVFPITFRLSRSIYINFFVSFDQKAPERSGR